MRVPSATDSDFTLWHALSKAQAAETVDVDPATGLTPDEVSKRLAHYGPNLITVKRQESVWDTILEEVREPMILLLLGTGVLYGLWGGLGDALTIFVVILI